MNVLTTEMKGTPCNGWPSSDLASCKEYCETNQVPDGCIVFRKHVCSYVVFDMTEMRWDILYLFEMIYSSRFNSVRSKYFFNLIITSIKIRIRTKHGTQNEAYSFYKI